MSAGRLVAIVVAAISIGGCGGGGGSGPSGPPVTLTPTSLQLSADAGTSIQVAGRIDLAFRVPVDGNTRLKVSWTGNGLRDVSPLGAVGGPPLFLNVSMRDPTVVGPGVFRDTITVSLCGDSTCRTTTGTAATATVEFTVTGVAPPRAALSLPSAVIDVDALRLGDVVRTIVPVTFSNITEPDVRFGRVDITSTGLVGVTTVPDLERSDRARLVIDLPDFRTYAPGTYTDVVTIDACDERTLFCQGTLAGTPTTLTVRVHVSDSVAGEKGYTVVSYPIAANALAWDASRSRVLYTGKGSDGRGGVFGTLNPLTGERGPSLALPGEANTIAVSDDGVYAYVGLDALGELHRIELETLRDDLTIPLGRSRFGDALRAARAVVAPAQPRTVAVLRSLPLGSSPQCAALTVFDDAIPRSAPVFNEPCPDWIEWGSTANTLYGSGSTPPPETLWTFAVGPNGTSAVKSIALPFLESFQFASANARAVTGRGSIFDLDSGQTIGKLQWPLDDVARLALNRAGDRIAALQIRGIDDPLVAVYDLGAQSLIDVVRLRRLRPRPLTFAAWGSNGFMFPTEDDRVVILYGPLFGR